MKKLLLLLVLFMLVPNISIYGQKILEEKRDSSILERLNKIEKLHNAFNVRVLLKGSAEFNFTDGQYDRTIFSNDLLRFQLWGEIGKKVFYDFRLRWNDNGQLLSNDNTSTSTDWAYLGFVINEHFTLLAGKMWANMGGFEPYENVLDIHLYSDFQNFLDAFLTGVYLDYHFNKQRFNFSITNAHNRSFDERYEGFDTAAIDQMGNPIMYNLNWAGSLFNGVVQTRWGFTISQEAKKQLSNQVALGTRLNLGKVRFDLDYYYAGEDFDTKGIVNEIINFNVEEGNMRQLAFDSRYHTIDGRLDYRVLDVLTLMGKYIYEVGGQANPAVDGISERYFETHGYMVGLEYYLTPDGLRIFLNYLGRNYNYHQDAQTAYGVINNKWSRINLGIMYKMHIF